jgi:hypothetical protein
MDAVKFDEATRNLARTHSRREILRGLAGVLAGAAASVVASGSAGAKNKGKPPAGTCKRDDQCAVGTTGFQACCNGACCASGVCDASGNCFPCDTGLVCGDTGHEQCCTAAESCVPASQGSTSSVCCAAERACRGECCPPGQTCVAEIICCPTNQVCGDRQCCPMGSTCLDPVDHTCCYDEFICGDECCAGANKTCCDGSCLDTSDDAQKLRCVRACLRSDRNVQQWPMRLPDRRLRRHLLRRCRAVRHRRRRRLNLLPGRLRLRGNRLLHARSAMLRRRLHRQVRSRVVRNLRPHRSCVRCGLHRNGDVLLRGLRRHPNRPRELRRLRPRLRYRHELRRGHLPNWLPSRLPHVRPSLLSPRSRRQQPVVLSRQPGVRLGLGWLRVLS